jgi:thioredoxin 1
MAPFVQGLADEYQGKVAMRKLDANSDPAVNQFNISGVPTYIFIDSTGKVIERVEGGLPGALQKAFAKAASL